MRLSPRRRRRIAQAVGYLVFALVIAVVVAAADWGRLSEAFFRLDIARGMFPGAITVALRNTIVYTLLAFVFGLTLGLILALMRLSSIPPYRWFATAYIELFRGLPALLVLFMVGYGVPLAFPDREIPGGVYGSVTVGLGLTAAAYMAETIRAGIQAVPKGQLEAARTLGMSHTRAMISIVLPQAFRIVIPPLTNEIILLTKDTSLVYVLGVTATTIELTKFAGDTLNTRVNPTPLVVAGLLYLLITLPMSQLVRGLERRAGRER
ncbi:polar amino acid transport system permease protein [Actinoplanes campanulatus]|uniref:Polar amino acid transport system permease protein n=1 Tax=Actinoplanes campanulatus TaxID=113559 RepID=A0A7W5AHH6_9ACTN|nr:amino acid ABC transporter permease [Actinoplanes campanulatus]MBB3096388.1 polar amino acid transport system permease protein [Actinoplanes campanulatus]GGN18673.1 amino acid ABC transporter permease [Actinoplanes campanulatus]GID38454.1 amino acid ABC transporter permease [Actinoplanes campanulatus]